MPGEKSKNIVLVLAGGLITIWWGIPFVLFYPSFSNLILVPPSHKTFLPWLGIGFTLWGIFLVVRGFTRRFKDATARVFSSLLLTVGIIHLHQLLLHRAPTVWSYADVLWPIVIGGWWKYLLRPEAEKTGS